MRRLSMDHRAAPARAGIRTRAAALALLAAAAPFCTPGAGRAQAARPEDQPGDLRMLADVWGADGSRIPPAVRAQEHAAVQRLFALLGRDPALASPRGYVVRTYEIYNHLDPAPAGVTTSYGLGVILIPWQLDENGRLFHRQNSSASDFLVLVNDVGCLGTRLMPDARGPIYALGDAAPDGYGRAVGDDVLGRRCVLLARGDRPVFIPVTKARFLADAVRAARDSVARYAHAAPAAARAPSLDDPQIRKTYEQYRKLDPKLAETYLNALKEAQAGMAADQAEGAARAAQVTAGVNDYVAQRLHTFEAELAALSPAEAAEPAWATSDWFRSQGPALARPGEAGAARLVQLDPEYFDRALPPAVPQLITIRTPADGQGQEWMRTIWQELDTRGLRAMLKP